MKKIVSCPVCGAKVGRGEEVKAWEVPCPKCKEMLIVNVTPQIVEVTVSIHPPKEVRPRTQSVS